MERNLYAPPAAPVVDPAETKKLLGDRPEEVIWAMRLLWTSFAVGIIATLAQNFLRSPLFFLVLTSGIPYLILGWILFKIGRGRHWARVTYLVLWMLGIVYTGYFWKHYAAFFDGKHSMAAARVVTETLLDLVGLCLLFMPRANRWFKPEDATTAR